MFVGCCRHEKRAWHKARCQADRYMSFGNLSCAPKSSWKEHINSLYCVTARNLPSRGWIHVPGTRRPRFFHWYLSYTPGNNHWRLWWILSPWKGTRRISYILAWRLRKDQISLLFWQAFKGTGHEPVKIFIYENTDTLFGSISSK